MEKKKTSDDLSRTKDVISVGHVNNSFEWTWGFKYKILKYEFRKYLPVYSFTLLIYIFCYSNDFHINFYSNNDYWNDVRNKQNINRMYLNDDVRVKDLLFLFFFFFVRTMISFITTMRRLIR